MNPARFSWLREIVLTAARLPPDARPAYLEEACAGDADLRREAKELLVHHGETPRIARTEALERLVEELRDGPETVREEPLPERLGPYRVLGVLGEGGMGIVYRAEQSEPIRREVAVKLVRSGAGSADAVARFESERQVLALVEHPNIAHLLDAGSHAGRPYFVPPRPGPVRGGAGSAQALPGGSRGSLRARALRGRLHAPQSRMAAQPRRRVRRGEGADGASFSRHRARRGGDSPGLAWCLKVLAIVFGNLGDHHGARPHLERALDIRERTLPADHPSLSHTHANLGRMFAMSGHPDEAIRHFERAVEIRESPVSLSHLGDLLTTAGRYEEARGVLERAVELAESTLPPGHPDLGEGVGALGRLLSETGGIRAGVQEGRGWLVGGTACADANGSVGRVRDRRGAEHPSPAPRKFAMAAISSIRLPRQCRAGTRMSTHGSVASIR